MVRKPGIWLIIIGLLLAVLGLYLKLSKPKNIPQQQDQLIAKSIEDITRINALINANETLLLQGTESDFLNFCNGESLIGMRLVSGTPQVWNNNDYQIEINRTNSFEIIQQNGIYLAVWNRNRASTSTVIAYNLFGLKFPEITSDQPYSPDIDLFIGNIPVEKSAKLPIPKTINTGDTPYYLVLFDYKLSKWPDLWLLIGILFMSMGVFLHGLEQFTRKWAWVNALLWMLVALLQSEGILFDSFDSTVLFSSKVFEYNSLLMNLANTLIVFFLILWLIRFGLFQLKQRFHFAHPGIQFATLILGWVLLGCLSMFAFHFTGFLVGKTDIHFRFTELLLLNGISIIAIGLIALLFAMIVSLSSFLQLFVPSKSLKNRIVSILGLATIFGLGYFYCNTQTIVYAAILCVVLLLRAWFYYPIPNYVRWISEVVLPCVLVSVWVNQSLVNEEINQRKLVVNSLMVEPDSEVKIQLTDAESGLNKDLPIFLSLGFQENKLEEFENTVKQEYFTSLIDNYDVSIFGYNAEGKNITTNKSADFGSLNALYFSDGGIQVTKQFYLINERRLSGSYIGKFNVYNDSALEAVYFILVAPSSARTKGRLTDVLNNSPTRDIINRNSYSYAIYSGRTLSKHFGDYNYPLTLNWPVTSESEMTYVEPNYHHIINEDSYGNLIIVSREKPSWLVASIQYTLFIFGGILFTILFYSWLWLEERLKLRTNPKFWNRQNLQQENMLYAPRFSGESWFISRRLQVYIIWLLISIFGLVLYTTINYFMLNNSERQEEELKAKVNQIANRISGQSNLDALVNQYEVGLIYDMAESYQTDINIYDAAGQLIVSTNPRLYQEQYRSNFMNPVAFRKFKSANSSTFVLNEHISELDYISAYSLINDNDLKVRGFVNLPYYSNRVDLYRNISTYMVTVVNVFILVFALVYIITQMISKRITQPLLIIRDEISRMKLGVRNEPITWNRKDEIGLLVNEYNKMIDALDVSLDKLSEVERQGAWREMAKQVAHEIKNPLTPMRLSLQHLEYAISRNDENIKDKISKTIKLLIRQIDSLSSMAEEFSSFAKMPEPKLERIDFNEVLQDAATLMEREMGYAIEISIPDQKILMMADPHQLGRVFNNLFKNALQAIPEGKTPQVRVETIIKSKEFVVTVSDNGKGIPTELYDKIFSPNFSTKNSGMGLGLAISRKIVEQFGGTIQFESIIDQGTTFTLVFPLVID